MRAAALVSIASLTALTAVACAAPDEADVGSDSSSIGVRGGANADATVDVSLCGSVDLYVEAKAHADGRLVVGGKPLVLRAGLVVDEQVKLALHANVCVHAKVDVHGKVVALLVLDAGASAGAGAGGSDGAGGSPGDCNDGTGGSSSGGSSSGGSSSGGSSSGGSSSGGGANVDLSADVHLCGRLDAFTAAGAQAGACTIAGTTLPIAAGTQLVGQAIATVGAEVCLDAHLDASGNVVNGSALSLDLDLLAGARVHVCGAVSAYVAATAVADGHLGIGGCGLDIDAGAKVSGAAYLAVGASVCVDASLALDGDIAACVVTSH